MRIGLLARAATNASARVALSSVEGLKVFALSVDAHTLKVIKK